MLAQIDEDENLPEMMFSRAESGMIFHGRRQKIHGQNRNTRLLTEEVGTTPPSDKSKTFKTIAKLQHKQRPRSERLSLGFKSSTDSGPSCFGKMTGKNKQTAASSGSKTANQMMEDILRIEKAQQ
jgi:hypothetical protein